MAKKQYYCGYGKIDSRNGVVYLLCTKTGNACKYQRYCTTDQCIKHTNNFVECPLKKGVDTQVSRNRRERNKRKAVVPQVATIEKVIENVGDDMRTTKRCKVILVTPDYFIIDTGDYTKRIQGKTDLQKGDWYILDIAPKEKEVIIEEKVEENVEIALENIEENIVESEEQSIEEEMQIIEE